MKEIKTCTSNEDNATLQCNEVLEQLKCTDGHAIRNVLKRRQSIIDSCLSNISNANLECLKRMSPNAHDSSRSVRNSSPMGIKTPIEKPLAKAKMLSASSKSVVAITGYLTNDFSKKELFVVKVEERHTKTKTNIALIMSKKYGKKFVKEEDIAKSLNFLKCPNETFKPTFFSCIGI